MLILLQRQRRVTMNQWDLQRARQVQYSVFKCYAGKWEQYE
jgi:hypothetical protein